MNITAIALIYFLLAAVTAYLAIRVFRHRRRQTVFPAFAAVSASISFALFSTALEMSVQNEQMAVFFNTLKFLGVVAIPPCLFILYLTFCGHKRLITPKLVLVFMLVPIVTVVLALTNSIHHLFWSSYRHIRSDAISYISFEPGAAFWVNSVFAYALLAVSAVLLLVHCLRKTRVYRGQSLAMLAGLSVAIALNALVIFNVVQNLGDFSLVAFAAGALCHYWALVLYKPDRMIRLARSMAVSRLENPILIFDDGLRLIDLNPSAARLFDCPMGTGFSEFTETLTGAADSESCQGLEVTREGSRYRLSDTAMTTKKGRLIGRVIAMDDITGLHASMEELAFRAEHDPVTGLLTRAAFTERLHSNDRLGELPLAVVCMSVVGLTALNSIEGLDRGEEVLRHVAGILRETVGSQGFCGRFGNNEFYLALAGLNESDAVQMASSVTAQVGKPEGIYYCLSYGVDVKTQTRENIDLIVLRAGSNRYRNTLLGAASYRKRMAESVIAHMRFEQSAGYLERALALAGRLGAALGLSDQEQHGLFLLVETHDIGLRSVVPESVLEKRGSLTNDEWEELKLHALKGHDIAVSLDFLAPIADAILAHHERYDGLGYPYRLSGEDIPWLARIFAVIDEAAQTDTFSPETLKRHSGSRFDPVVVEALLGLEQ